MRIHYAAGVNSQQNLSGSSITLCNLIARFPRVLCDWSSCMRFSSRRSDLPEAKTRAFSFCTECQNNHPDKKFSSLIPIADTSYAIYDGYQVFGSRARLRRALRVRPSLRLRAPPLRHLGPALNLEQHLPQSTRNSPGWGSQSILSTTTRDRKATLIVLHGPVATDAFDGFVNKKGFR